MGVFNKPLQRGHLDLFITDINNTKWLFSLQITDNTCQIDVFYFLPETNRITAPLLEQDKKIICKPFEQDVVQAINRFMAKPLTKIIFKTKDLEIGKTYKGLINQAFFKVLRKETTFHWHGNHQLSEDCLVIQDEQDKTYRISPHSKLYVQEV